MLYIMFFLYLLFGESVFATEERSKDENVKIVQPSNQAISFPTLYADPYEIQMGFSKSLNSGRFIGRIGQEIALFRIGVFKQKNPF